MPRRLSEAGSKASADSAESQPHSSRNLPASMPVPAAPRRAAPPRKKPSKPTAPPPPVPEDGPDLENAPPKTDAPAASEPKAISEMQMEIAPPTEALVTPLPPTPTPAESASSASSESMKVQENRQSIEVIPSNDAKDSTQVVAPPDPEVIPQAPSPPDSRMESPSPRESEAEAMEIDDETRRRQVAERIAKMGGINPLAAPLAQRKTSSASEDLASPEVAAPPLPADVEQKRAQTELRAESPAAEAKEALQEGDDAKPISEHPDAKDKETKIDSPSLSPAPTSDREENGGDKSVNEVDGKY